MLANYSPSKEYRYLDTALLRPGDVLLMRSDGWQSRAIAWSTFGRFSHAALVCKEGVIFESDDAGVGFGMMRTMKVKRPHGWVEWSRLSHGYRSMRVYRHSDMNVEPDAIMASCRTYFGSPYSYTDRLASAVPIWPGFLRSPLRWGLRRLEDRKWIPGLHGAFCSEVVALVFRDLGLELFPRKKRAEAVSPNGLGRSLLRPVPDAVITLADAEAARSTNPDLDTRGGEFPRDRLLGGLVELAELDARLDEMINQAKANFRCEQERKSEERGNEA